MTLKQNPERLNYILDRKAPRGRVIHSTAVVGAAVGLGLEWDAGAGYYVRMKQTSGVVLPDNVFIGANSVVQCGAVDDTTIGDDTYIGSLVLIGHGCRIGKHVVICGGARLKGSLVIGNRAVIGMGAVVIADVPENGFVRAGSVWE
jgi:UDP-3-O-[3-hydroxymyristoyl] glucosamine N-acyltransferase